MRIIILSDYFDDRGGAVGVAKATAFGLKKSGHDVSVITTTQNEAKAGRSNKNGIDAYYIYSDYNLFWRSYVGLYNPKTIKAVKEIFAKIKPDIVHAHNIHTQISYWALKLAKKTDAKVFLTVHDAMLFHYGKITEFIDKNDLTCSKELNYHVSVWQQIKKAGKTYNPLRNFIIRRHLKYVDKIFAVSGALKQALNDNGVQNVDVVYNGIRAEDWQFNGKAINDFKERFDLENRKIIFFGSRLSEIKGQELIVFMIKKVVEKFPDTSLLIAGKTNKNMLTILNLAHKLGVKKKVICSGWLSGEELKAAIQVSEMVILPSPYFDSFPLLNLEAMACKKPVVATCFGGSREVVSDGKTGYIVNPFNTKAMADRIIDLLKNPEKARQFGETGYERVKNEFNLEKMVHAYLNWYRN